ncbi:Co2+/Mg2+ efflux protein ApaG [Vicingaceae bacterium]|jgi:ApaG protein|nr:Co2+/Mg2+ efflux protein ApaG [Vicingaceae bacterium]
MVKPLTHDVKITVKTSFNIGESRPLEQFFVFNYIITIENQSDQPLQLLKRHWIIVDSNGEKAEVKGDGVVGKQPILMPNDKYAYQSHCIFKTPVGKMSGSYLMKNLAKNEDYLIPINAFRFCMPTLLN